MAKNILKKIQFKQQYTEHKQLKHFRSSIIAKIGTNIDFVIIKLKHH